MNEFAGVLLIILIIIVLMKNSIKSKKDTNYYKWKRKVLKIRKKND